MFSYLKYFPGRMVVLLLFFPFLFSCSVVRVTGKGETYSPDIQFESRLAPELEETSGLAFLEGYFLSFNDSGGDAALYSFPVNAWQSLKKTVILNAQNHDWEDICQDSSYIYIADSGNNFGQRDNLTIYRLKNNILSEDTVKVDAEFRIVFREKTREYYRCSRNPFDCEAIIHKDDSLFLFTKNWQDESSWIYVLPAEPGQYLLSRSSVLRPEMLVTGAYYSRENSVLWLIGYHHWKPVVTAYEFHSSVNHRQLLRVKFNKLWGIQSESICEAEGRMYFTFEKSRRKQGIYSIARFR